jgi:hypothetical protein
MTTTINLNELKRLAVAAEGARFITEGFDQEVGNGQFYGGLIMHENGHTIIAQCVLSPWADFIAAANPATILALVARIEEADVGIKVPRGSGYCDQCGAGRSQRRTSPEGYFEDI